MKKILFVNHDKIQCGVYQYGHNFYGFLAADPNISVEYLRVDNLNAVVVAEKESEYDLVIFNYHPNTEPFISSLLTNGNRRMFRCPTAALLHIPTPGFNEVMGDDKLFQFALFGDESSSTCGMGDRVRHFGRILPYYVNSHPVPEIPTIGSYGCAHEDKGYADIIRLTQDSFNEAIVKINIFVNSFIGQSLQDASRNDDAYRAVATKPGIKVEITHNFYDSYGIVDFLGQNSINVFPYKKYENEDPCVGISSSPDLAIACGRPMAINKSNVFRHISQFNLPILVEDQSLRQIMEGGPDVVRPLREAWSQKNQRAAIYRALNLI